jgi:hypothetical protein
MGTLGGKKRKKREALPGDKKREEKKDAWKEKFI